MRAGLLPPVALGLVLVLAASAGAADEDFVVVARDAIDGDTLRLEDGSELRLTGLRAPKPYQRGEERWAAQARALLDHLAAGKRLRLEQAGARYDRHRRLLAQATVADGPWLQGALLEAGLARVETFADNRARAAEMLAIEAAARMAGRGLWADPRFRVLEADAAELPADGYHLVEGRVTKVVERRDRIYLDFGADWRRDFSVSIPRKDRARFAAAGIDPAGLAGRRLRVRGWLRIFNGPMIDATHPEQIELVP